MKLTYLDTSDFILLSNEKRKGNKNYEDFLVKWKENDLTLAFSQIHLFELLQAKYSATRVAHFELLKDFLPFRYESENFFEREITTELFKKGFIIFQEGDKESLLRFFSKEIVKEENISAIYSASNIISRIGFHRAFSKANKFSWEAKSKDTFHKTPKLRFSKMGHTWLGSLAKRGFAKFVGIDYKDKKNQNKSVEAILEEFLFKIQVKSSLKSKFGKIEESLQKNILNSINIKDCRGLWLRKEVEKNLKMANDFDPNNENDLNHLQYLPYVDNFVTDKRIVDKINQVLRREGLIDSLKAISLPTKSSNSIQSLEKFLFGKVETNLTK